MNVGTKSLLFGAHQVLIHPFFVWRAYCKLYGFTLKPQILVACVVHDWGYWGCGDMDGVEGKQHPILGAKIMHWLFDKKQKPDHTYKPMLPTMKYNFVPGQSKVGMSKSFEWYDFCLLHSRSIAKAHNRPPSKLCAADKLASALVPAWLYLPMVFLTGEVREYAENTVKAYQEGSKRVSSEWYIYSALTADGAGLFSYAARGWFNGLKAYMHKWVEENVEKERTQRRGLTQIVAPE